MFGPTPTSYFLTAGSGEASTELNAFDSALLDAGVGDTNLIKMSSILPPGAKEIQRLALKKGSFIPLAYGERSSDFPGLQISAAVAVGIPEDPLEAGLIMEFSHEGDPESCEKIARNMVKEGMEVIRNRKILEIKSISATINVTRVGAVFAAVVLCP
ncbi:MAG: arginine decarboxylase, pyruvoyl-dependent [Deltaproteobacteria bacterium]|nr:arginine decarboxylase, pyruvoyl-dependent [Deltaproteobacteria bacterium]